MSDLSDGVNWSEIDANNNASPPLGWPEGMMPSGVNDAARSDKGALKRFWNKINPVQLITPSGGLWTFTTDNPAYPIAYVNGEIYCFSGLNVSNAGDQFRVNSLPAKPIWKHVAWGPAGWSPIGYHDFPIEIVQLLYDSSLNGGAGAFVLLNPYVPIGGDGAGGVSVPGNLAVAGDLTLTGSVAAVGGLSINGDLEVLGHVAATGYASRSGTAGPYQTNFWNIQWAGADGAHLWIDTTDQGPIVTAPGGNIVIGGSIAAGSVTASGNISAGTLSVGGDTTLGNVSATGDLSTHTLTASGGVTVTAGGANIQGGLYIASGNVSVVGDLGAHTLSASGGVTVTAGGVNIVAGGLNVGGGATTLGNTSITGPFNVYTGPVGISAPVTITGNVGIIGNLTVSGLLNGHPAMAMTELMTQLDALMARVQALEGR